MKEINQVELEKANALATKIYENIKNAKKSADAIKSALNRGE